MTHRNATRIMKRLLWVTHSLFICLSM